MAGRSMNSTWPTRAPNGQQELRLRLPNNEQFNLSKFLKNHLAFFVFAQNAMVKSRGVLSTAFCEKKGDHAKKGIMAPRRFAKFAVLSI